MIIDTSGIVLVPGNNGNDCPGNGEHCDKKGNQIICCDECTYQLCCNSETDCISCRDTNCPRKQLPETQ